MGPAKSIPRSHHTQASHRILYVTREEFRTGATTLGFSRRRCANGGIAADTNIDAAPNGVLANDLVHAEKLWKNAIAT